MATLVETQNSLKNLSAEAFKLTPSALVTLFEIDISNVGFNNSVIQQNTKKIYRFHNMIKLVSTDIIWRGNIYKPAPINVTGYEISGKGTLPTPELSISVNDQGIPLLSQLRTQISFLGDLVGAKVTRIRTFAKFLDSDNFNGQEQPTGFSPDPGSEYPRDVFFIERKELENKKTINYKLSSILDLHGLQLPARQVIANRCMFTYRGEGCLYEYGGIGDKDRKNSTVHGDGFLPLEAPPVATNNDELIYGDIITDGTPHLDRGTFDLTSTYQKGHAVYITKDNINYYFVAKTTVPVGKTPPNTKYWVADLCSKCIRACKLRFSSLGQGHLPFGGFPGVTRLNEQ